MNNQPLRCGIIGTGAFAQEHARVIAESSAIDLAAACDSDEEKCKSYADQWRTSAHGTVDALLESEHLDVIALTTPDATHGALIQEVIGHVRAPTVCITEKPLCTKKHELDAIERMLSDHTTQLVVNHTRRYAGAFDTLKDRIDAGEFGDLLSVTWTYYAGWFCNGVHIVDTLRMLLGELQCTDAILGGIDRHEDDPLLNVTLRADRHPNAGIELVGIPEHPHQQFECILLFNNGRIRIQWDDIFLDALGEDFKGARPLEFREHVKAESSPVALRNLYHLASRYIGDDNPEILNRSGFAVASGTMETLFSAQSIAHG